MATDVLDRASALVTQVRGRPLDIQQREKPALWERSQDIFRAAQAENRPMNEAESARYDELTSLIADVNKREQEEKANADLDREFASPRRDSRMLPTDEETAATRSTDRKDYRAALNTYLRYGRGELEPEQHRLLRAGFNTHPEVRAAGTAPGSAGGYLVPTGFSGEIIETLKYFGGMNQVATIQETDTGNPIEWPTNDDTTNVGALVAENTSMAAATDLVFGQKLISAYLFSSRPLLVALPLLQDAGVDIEAYLARKIGQRLGRVYNTYQTTGTGAAQPQGITVGASVGKTAAAAAAITYNELIDLEHSVNIAYRQSFPVPNGGDGKQGDRVGYMFNDASVFAALRKLADSQTRPLWVPWLGQGVAGAVPATFNGWNYWINDDMPSLATTAKTVAFGNFTESYLIRSVKGFSLIRLDELYIGSGQIGFLAFGRMDAGVVDAGAVKLLQQA